MDILKMKLALTVDFMNSSLSQSPVSFAEKAMLKFGNDAGHLTGTAEGKKSALGKSLVKQHIMLLYENCTLDLVLVKDNLHNSQFVQGFNLTPHFA